MERFGITPFVVKYALLLLLFNILNAAALYWYSHRR